MPLLSDWIDPASLTALFVSLKLAAVTTVLLFITCVPLAIWLATKRSTLTQSLLVISLLPLVLPPTVLGFYILWLTREGSFLGGLWIAIFGESLAFSFNGLVFASYIYSLPFFLQPSVITFQNVDPADIRLARSLGAPRLKIFSQILWPQIRSGLAIASTLAFAHTLGEFGVVLMIGGALPGETRVISIAIFEKVELLDFDAAWNLSLILVAIAILALSFSQFWAQRWSRHHRQD